jgi:hypothetical protein
MNDSFSWLGGIVWQGLDKTSKAAFATIGTSSSIRCRAQICNKNPRGRDDLSVGQVDSPSCPRRGPPSYAGLPSETLRAGDSSRNCSEHLICRTAPIRRRHEFLFCGIGLTELAEKNAPLSGIIPLQLEQRLRYARRSIHGDGEDG